MNAKDKITKKSELLLSVLIYAQKNKIDINNRGEVKKIIKFLSVPIEKDEIEKFIDLVQDTDTYMDLLESKRNHKKSKATN
jgi:hypothetical protein